MLISSPPNYKKIISAIIFFIFNPLIAEKIVSLQMKTLNSIEEDILDEELYINSF